jgi:hypothetical protein
MSSLLKPEGWSFLGTHGLIQVNTTYLTERKPVGVVLLRIAGLCVILAVATGLIAPPLTIVMPAWKATVAMIGLVLIYLGVSFFIRPQADEERRGWQGGASVDPTRFHRLLVALHWMLAPGRFAAETLLDVCALMGLVGGSEIQDRQQNPSPPVIPMQPALYSQAADRNWDGT